MRKFSLNRPINELAGFWQKNGSSPAFRDVGDRALLLIVKELYPFSHFPMYSNIEPKSHYFYLANGNDEPLKGKRYFGIAMSNMKKKYHSFLTPLAEVRSDEAGKRIKASELGEADQEQCGQNLIEYLLPRGDARGSWKRDKPDVLRLVRVDIKREGTALKETKRVISERSIAK